MNDRDGLLRELMAVFDQLPASLREAINYATEPLDPKSLAALCRRHGAANVLAMIELKRRRAGGGEPDPTVPRRKSPARSKSFRKSPRLP